MPLVCFSFLFAAQELAAAIDCLYSCGGRGRRRLKEPGSGDVVAKPNHDKDNDKAADSPAYADVGDTASGAVGACSGGRYGQPDSSSRRRCVQQTVGSVSSAASSRGGCSILHDTPAAPRSARRGTRCCAPHRRANATINAQVPRERPGRRQRDADRRIGAANTAARKIIIPFHCQS